MAYYVTSSDTLTDLADAIREKGGTTDPLEFPDEFISAIDDIVTEPNLQAKTNIDPTESSQTIYPDRQEELVDSFQCGRGSAVATVDLSSISVGETVSVRGRIGETSSGGVVVGITSINHEFVWTGNTYTYNVVNYGDIVITPTSVTYSGSVRNWTIFGENSVNSDALINKYVSAYDGLSYVQINGISSSYVGSGIDRRDETDLTASGATVTVPAGYYAESETKSVASGSAGTPTATKGTVSNHTISVTPSVTNTTGYITGGTKTGTAVTVQASELVSGTKSITTNGTGIDVANYSTVDVAVSGDVPVYQAKTGIVPTENSQTISADSGYDALSSVQINGIPSNYVGSGIDRRDDTDLTASGATVTVPSGYYADDETKTIASGSARTPDTTITANPTISVDSGGLITATYNGGSSVTPTVTPGYVSTGTTGTIAVKVNKTQQLPVQAAQTIHPSTTDQTIASGKYLTGAQTIKAVTTTNLAAENILAGVTVKIGDSTDDDCVASVTGTASSGGGIVVVETPDEHGGTIVEITGEEVKLQAKSNISPTESSQTIEPDTGYTGLSSVQINAISSSYVGTGITRRSSTDLTASGATVTVPAGYYETQGSKAVATGTATAPTSISGTTATVSTGTNTLTLSKTVSVTPRITAAGYVSAGTAGNSSVSLTANVTTKAAATITPTKSTQTIASGTYLTGTQTIAAIPAAYQDVTGVTAAAGDVVSGKSIVDSSGNTVNGSLVIQHYYTGSGTPSSSTGVNGDIYLQTS